MLHEEDNYYENLQRYVDKVKELKEWKNHSKDAETIGYLKLEIEKLLSEMNDLVSKRNLN
jgi:hypothetical protein